MSIILANIDFRWGGRGAGRVLECVGGDFLWGGGGGGGGGGGTEVDASIFYLIAKRRCPKYFKGKTMRWTGGKLCFRELLMLRYFYIVYTSCVQYSRPPREDKGL